MVLLIRQMEATGTQAAVAKVSLLTVGQQAIMDAYLCLLHLTTGASAALYILNITLTHTDPFRRGRGSAARPPRARLRLRCKGAHAASGWVCLPWLCVPAAGEPR